MNWWFRTVIPLLFIVGCAVTTKKETPKPQELAQDDLLPPEYQVSVGVEATDIDQYLQNIGSSTSKRGVKWWAQYRRAQYWQKQQDQKACELFLELARDEDFPLKKIAELRAEQSCEPGYRELAILGLDQVNQMDPWLRPMALEVALAQAESRNDKAQIMKLSFEKSKASTIRSEKMELTQRALRLAKELNDSKAYKVLSERLYRLAPRLIPKPRFEDYLKVAFDYRRERNFPKARAFYLKVLNSKKASFHAKLSATRGIALCYKLDRDREKYLYWLKNAAKLVAKEHQRHPKDRKLLGLYHDSSLELARAQWTMGEVKNANQLLRALAKNLKKRYSLAEVYWLLGRMDEEKQKYDAAVWWFDKSKSETFKNTDFRDKVYWYLAWNQIKMKNYQEAIANLTEMKEKTENVFARSKFSFWLAKALKADGKTEEATAELDRLIEEDPIGYYGLLAYREKGTKIQHPANSRSVASSIAVTPASEDLLEVLNPLYIKWLISVEESDIAQFYLDHVSQAFRRRNNQSQHAWLTVFNYYAQAGNYLGLFNQLGQIGAEQRKAILEVQPQLIFPTPYEEYVKLAADQSGLSKEFIYAIMRQESAFNPRARSPADAFGLMQVLPEVAHKAAAQIGMEIRSKEDLYDPQVNITLGAYHLKELWNRYSGKFILATASYNASEKAIQGWLKTRYRGDTLEFIEDIPYEETQAYIKLVLRNMIFYQLIGNGHEPIDFPEWALELTSPDA